MVDRQTYMEVIDFLILSGGAYRCLDSFTCQEIISALDDSRCRIVRDDQGQIITFSSWWMIHEADLEAVREGQRPADVVSGSIVYVADHAGQGAYPDLIRFIKQNIGKKGVCWHHRTRQPDLFRYYPNKEGAHND